MPDQPQPPPTQPPRLFGSGRIAELVRDCPSFQSGFKPASLLSSPHAQTLYGVAREPAERLRRRLWFPSGGGARRKSSDTSAGSNSNNSNSSSKNSNGWAFRRQLVHTEDGGTIALDWWEEQRRKKRPEKSKQQQHQTPPSSTSSTSSSLSSSSPSSLPLPPTAPLLLVLHGLTGGSKEGYVKSLCAHGTSKGFRAVAVVYRGCGGLKLTSRRAYSATFTSDVSRAAQQARREFPLAASVVAVGFSLGAIILSKYLGEQDAGYWHHGRGGGSGGNGREEEEEEESGGEESGGGEIKGKQKKKKKKKKHFRLSPHHSAHSGENENDDLIDAAVAVSSPFCLESAGERLSRPWTVGWLYNAGLALRLKHYMFTHRAQILRDDGEGGEGEEASDVKGDGDGDGDCGEKTEKKNDFENSSKKIDARALATSYLVSHIDDAASARANGYADRGDYYADAATRKAIPHVTRTPLLFVSSADDAFLGEVPLREIEANPRTALVVTEKGGHCAFLDGDEESAWVDRLALEWLSRAVARREVLSKL